MGLISDLKGKKKQKDIIFYTAGGEVLGNLWGGGKGWYPARAYKHTSKKVLLNEIRKDLKSGALDSGMGYQNLIKANMAITKHTIKRIGNDNFINEKTTTARLKNKGAK